MPLPRKDWGAYLAWAVKCCRLATEILDSFARFTSPTEVGPVVWDIHSPRVPSMGKMAMLLEKALTVIPRQEPWGHPDCELKIHD